MPCKGVHNPMLCDSWMESDGDIQMIQILMRNNASRICIETGNNSQDSKRYNIKMATDILNVVIMETIKGELHELGPGGYPGGLI